MSGTSLLKGFAEILVNDDCWETRNTGRIHQKSQRSNHLKDWVKGWKTGAGASERGSAVSVHSGSTQHRASPCAGLDAACEQW
jgi:hypothetical protein